MWFNNSFVIIWFNDPLFYTNLMGSFLLFLVLDYGFEVHVKIAGVLVYSLFGQDVLIFTTNSLQNIWFVFLLILVIVLLLFWVCFNVTFLLVCDLFNLWFGSRNLLLWFLPEFWCYFVDYLICKFFGDLLVVYGSHQLCENFFSGLILLNS